MGYYQIKLDAGSQKHEKIKMETRNNGNQDFQDPIAIQNVISKLIQDMEYVKTNMLS
jgi:hypothetical protein